MHIKTGGRIVEFGGFLLPLQYDGIIKEHLWCRSSCAIFDTSHMAKFIFRVKKTSLELGHLFTIDIEKIPAGCCRYCFLLNEDGGIIDDVVVYKLSDSEYMAVSNAATKLKVQGWYLSHLKETEIVEADTYLDKIDIQGPLSADVLRDLFQIDLSMLSFYHFSRFTLLKEEAFISYSGYTGGKGYEIYITKQKTEELWEALLQDGRVKPAGLGARDSLRLEAGLPLYGNELDEETTPIEAGLGRFVDFSHDFIGKDILKENPPKKKIVFLISETRQSPRYSYKIFSGDEEIGYITSGCFSPSIQKGIGIGYIKKDITVPDKVSISAEKEGCGKINCYIIPRKQLVRAAGLKK